ncbi:cupredoxin domain-containing protein [Alkalihalobacterium alkalinitrilicum]|uniref:cupredoxin domain-containing protein n=1 Tax=Alkalihalobacterium alkalinitrilicum TaxID=427920 RepID=UPI000995B85E|nr:cupredoxin domain-containing protein [Alkalihalobacterium alkalinitrilicum]
MINSYTKFASTLLLLQVITILFAGSIVLRHFPPIHVINGIICLIIAFLLFRLKGKWIPAIGILYGFIFSILTVPSLIISMFRNIDPEYNAMMEASNPYMGVSFLSAIFVLGIFIFSLTGLISNLRDSHEPPTWLPKVKGLFYGATVMGLFISFYSQLHWVSGINGNTIEQLPTIVMKPDSVEPATLEVKAGEPIVFHIQNQSDNKCHILSFPDLNASVHMERGRSGLIIINPEPGTYSYECKEHHGFHNENIKGTLTVIDGNSVN